MDTSSEAIPERRRRRQHSAEFKAKIVETCRQPGVSIAATALFNGLNANMVRKWVSEAEGHRSAAWIDQPRTEVEPVPGFIALAPPSASAPAAIQIELKRGALGIRISWPLEAASVFSTCLSELLR
jgi:transposase-like protein